MVELEQNLVWTLGEMTQVKNDKDQNDVEQHPPNIPTEDWVRTPDSVRKFVESLLAVKQGQGVVPKSYIPTWPTWIMLSVNALIVIALDFLLVNNFAVRCIYPAQVSALSLALIFTVIFHLFWRNVYPLVPSEFNIEGKIEIKIITVPLNTLLNALKTLLNEIHPWKLSNRLLGFIFLVIFVGGAFFNLSSISPFYVEDEPSLQGFSIERFDTPPLRLAIGQTLTITPGEKVFVEAVILNEIEASCSWTMATSAKIEKRDCSTVLAMMPGIKRDVLTVIVQPICGKRQESASLPVVVQP